MSRPEPPADVARALRRVLHVLLWAYVVKQLVFVFAFPPFTGHDEVAHYAYLRTVAVDGRLPRLLQDTMPPELAGYRRFALDWPDETRPGPLYLANHPPLYYAVMTPVYWATAGHSPEVQQYALRLAAIPFGLLTVWLAARLAAIVFPGDPFLLIAVPLFVAFQPQISYEAAMVNNDIVAIAAYSAILCALAAAVRDRFPPRLTFALGALLGLGLLTKGTTMTIVPVIGLGALMTPPWRVGDWVGRAWRVALPALVVSAPWYAFLYRAYGNFSGLAQVQELQRHWNGPAGTFPSLLFSLDFIAMRFRETWGEFGWRRIPLDSTLLVVIALALGIATAGLLVYAAVPADRTTADPVRRPAGWQVTVLLLMAATCAVAYLAVVQYGTQFELTQARYFFPAVNAASLLLMLGLRTWLPPGGHRAGLLGLLVALVGLNGLIVGGYVLPYYDRW